MQAIHTVVTERGKFFQVRGSSEDEIRQIKYVAAATIGDSIVDVVDEVRGESELEADCEDDDKENVPIETQFLKKDMDIVEVPRDIDKLKLLGISVDVLMKKFGELVERVDHLDEIKEVPVEPVEVQLIEETPVEEAVTEEIFEPEEYVEMNIRPLKDVKIIVGVAETKDHTSLFDE